LTNSKIKTNKTIFLDLIAIAYKTTKKNINTTFLNKLKTKYQIKLKNKLSTTFSVYTHTPPITKREEIKKYQNTVLNYKKITS
jgi:hypothetical protein